MAVPLPVTDTFTYLVPLPLTSSISIGKRVLVPFGHRQVTGYIFGLTETTTMENIKNILDVLDDEPLFPESMIPFFKWIADYYMYPIGQAVQCALPAGLTFHDVAVLSLTKEGRRILSGMSVPSLEHEVLSLLGNRPYRQKELNRLFDNNITSAFVRTLIRKKWVTREKSLVVSKTKARMEKYVAILNSDIPLDGRSVTRKKVIEHLQSRGEMSVSELKKHVPTARPVLKPLEKTGHIKIGFKKMYRDPFGEPIQQDTPPHLTDEQKVVVDRIMKSLGKGYETYLLTGVTGSGKTEVYMQLAEKTLESGHNVLVLVPEIALITQVERRFRARFGECVGVLHSGLSNGERYDQWVRVLEKKAPIVIGARSAVFAPFDNIGLIIVDEEHEPTYKQDHGLMYHARDLAVKRASMCGCVAVLGSATPSIQSYFNVETGKYKAVGLTKRVEERPLSKIQLVDLRKTRDVRGIRKFISPELIHAMKETLAREEQILLFLNRRGFANYSVCGACGEPVKCKNCDISLTLHKKNNLYKCHYCGFFRAAVSSCSLCGSHHIRNLGLGTEKIENFLLKLFPEARIARMDQDTTKRKGSILKILKGIRNNSIDILVGTQMVAKGHDFPNITLVGVICADLSLSFPDFRAGARTFQLLAQVAGRAGRGDAPGRVIFQTYNPKHFSISTATTQDYKTFYLQEISFRKSLHYPPSTRFVQLRISGKHMENTKQHALLMGDIINHMKHEKSYSDAIVVLGPIESAMHRIANQYRWQIILKGHRAKQLHRFVKALISKHPTLFNNNKAKVIVDVDPIFMM